ncbi:MAG TPA: FG-GAP-like repeat-containing protein, partial [Candidatus Gracilibacteria bacterium]|nr:FG-GAP-like repeat-containing protein [Candidatus Gracilibacteria bacterium]
IHIQLLDEHNNIVNNDVTTVTIDASGPGSLDGMLDEQPDTPGVQLSSVTGEFDIALGSTVDSGDVQVTASYAIPQDDVTGDGASSTQETQPAQAAPTVTGSTTVQSRNDLKLILTPDLDSIPSDYATVTNVTLQVVDNGNQLVNGFQGTARFSLLDDQYGELLGETERIIVDGKVSIIFRAKNIAGNSVISATAEGFDPANATVKTLPKKAAKIVLESKTDTIDADPSQSLEITGKLYDNDDNFVSTDSSTTVTFSLTEVSKTFGAFLDPVNVQAQDGVVTIRVRGADISGPINILAASAGIQSGTISLNAVKKFNAEDMNDITPRVLFASLLGTDFGNVFEDNYFAGWFIFAGNSQDVSRAQAAVSLLSPPKPAGRLVEFGANGKLKLFDEGGLDVRVIPHNSSSQPNRYIVSNLEDQNDLVEMFMIAKVQTKASEIGADADPIPMPEGVYIQQIIGSTDYDLKQTETGVSVMKKGNVAVEILNNGNIKVIDNAFNVEFDTSAERPMLTLSVLDDTSEIAKIYYRMEFFNDVTNLDPDIVVNLNSSSYQPGVYVRKLSSKRNVDTEISFGGNSTAKPKGIYVIDKDITLPQNQAPGLNYISLEKSADVPGLGFTGDNKHMLLFAAGNSVGEANLPYSSEIGVVIGDPTVRISNKSTASDTGFTKDIGQEIFAGDQPIQDMSVIDYNSDGLDDLLVAYESGQVRLLQNNRAYPRFEDRGIFLNFVSGVMSMTVNDFDHDGQQDLVIATRDNCREGEVCIDMYENHEGNFVRRNLDLEPFTDINRVYMLTSGDVNNDTYPELITSDDTGAIRVFYNSAGSIQKFGDLIGSLGIKVDPSKNLKTEVLVTYDGAPQNQPGTTDDIDFVAFAVPSGETNLLESQQDAQDAINDTASDLVKIEGGISEANEARDFIYLDLDPKLGIQSVKSAKDVTDPSNVTARGDTIEYKLTIKNTNAGSLQNVMVSDVISSNVELDESSLACLDCPQPVTVIESGQSLHPLIFLLGSVPGNGTRTLQYSVSVKKTPKVNIMAGQDLNSGYVNDN